MRARRHPAWPKESLPNAAPETRGRQAHALWLALQLSDPAPDAALLEALAGWAEALTPVVVLRPGEGLLLEIRGSLRYFSGLAAIRQRLVAELERRGWTIRLAIARPRGSQLAGPRRSVKLPSGPAGRRHQPAPPRPRGRDAAPARADGSP
jgi:hypothetical protein